MHGFFFIYFFGHMKKVHHVHPAMIPHTLQPTILQFFGADLLFQILHLMKGAPVGINVMACRWPLNKTCRFPCSSLKPGGWESQNGEWQFFSTNDPMESLKKNGKNSKIFRFFFLTQKKIQNEKLQAAAKHPRKIRNRIARWIHPGKDLGAARYRQTNQIPVATGSGWINVKKHNLIWNPTLPKFTLPSQSSYVKHQFCLAKAQLLCRGPTFRVSSISSCFNLTITSVSLEGSSAGD